MKALILRQLRFKRKERERERGERVKQDETKQNGKKTRKILSTREKVKKRKKIRLNLGSFAGRNARNMLH